MCLAKALYSKGLLHNGVIRRVLLISGRHSGAAEAAILFPLILSFPRSLFFAQYLHGVNPRRSHRWKQTSKHSNQR
jgi:hypothetical protein